MPPSRVAGRPLSLPDWFPHAFGAALIIVVVSALTFAAIWMEASRSQREAEVSTQNLSLLVAEQVSGLYARADALILAAVNYHRDASRHGRIERTRINAFLTEALKQLPEAQNLRILDRNGILRYGNDDLVDVSFADRAYFTRARDNPEAGLVFDGPLLGRITYRPLIFLSRRLVDNDGAFAGIAYVTPAELMRSLADVAGVGADRSRWLGTPLDMAVQAALAEVAAAHPLLRAAWESDGSRPGRRRATAVRLAQIVSGATPDGKIGPKTLAALNAMDPDKFALAYALAKLARYRDIVTKDRTQQKFLLGWINRTLREAA